MASYISSVGYKRMQDELEKLKAERPAITQAIKEARAEGDLSENAGYDAARERQGMNEAQIRHLESALAGSTIVDLDTLSGDKVIFGATVDIVDSETDEERTYTILGPDEADAKKGVISLLSPVGRALLGKEVGDELSIEVPKGIVTYEITDIRFEGSAGLAEK